MVVAISAQNKLIWSVTSQQIREHWNILHIYLHAAAYDLTRWDFGRGKELSFRCPGCHRFCPVETATIDHVVPRSRIGVVYLDPLSNRTTGFSGDTFYMKEEGQLDVLPLDTTRRAVRLHYRVRRGWGADLIECFRFSGSDFDFDFDFDFDYKKAMGPIYRWTVNDLVKNLLENLQPMCAYCNSCKGNR